MDIKEYSNQVNERLEISGTYKKIYIAKRIDFWMEQAMLLMMSLFPTLAILSVTDLPLFVIEMLYLVTSGVLTFLSYKTDRSPQSPKEVKDSLRKEILAGCILTMLEENLVYLAYPKQEKLEEPTDAEVVTNGGKAI